MKLKDLTESPITIDSFPELSVASTESIVKQLASAVEIEVVEGKYSLVKADDLFALKEKDVILGFARTSFVEYHSVEYLKINMIYVFPEFRKDKIGQKLLLGIKETSDRKIICDDVVSSAGFKLLSTYPFEIKSLEKDSGLTRDIKPKDSQDKNIAYVLENKTIGLWRQNFLPELEHKDYLIFSFEEWIKE